ncbi:GntR family transcriptional regulator [Nocardioides sp. BGMRC 2183]|nr:GntR family transcriptional regulator [Nocardioides sp. BGMRC 2183]
MTLSPNAGNSQTTLSVAPAPLAEQVFTTLREWIVIGELRPGQRLRVRDLADAVGTSVMPVRDAIRRLVECGLAEHEAYKGARVRELDAAELENIYAVRILVEGEAARLGAVSATPGVVEQMREHWSELDRAARSGDVSEALRRDELLLSTLYVAGENDVLVSVVSNLWDKVRPYKVVWATAATGRGDLSMWHFAPELIEAVTANDAAGAEAIMRDTYAAARSAILATLEP